MLRILKKKILACHVNLLSLKDPHSLFLPEILNLITIPIYNPGDAYPPDHGDHVFREDLWGHHFEANSNTRIMSNDPKDPSPQTSGQVVLPHIVVSSLAGGDYLCQQRPLCLDFVEFTWIWK